MCGVLPGEWDLNVERVYLSSGKPLDIMPIGKRLGEKVFADIALKLKPYLTQAVKSLDLSLHEYSKVVTSILEGTTIVVEHSSDHTLKNQLLNLRYQKQYLIPHHMS